MSENSLIATRTYNNSCLNSSYIAFLQKFLLTTHTQCMNVVLVLSEVLLGNLVHTKESHNVLYKAITAHLITVAMRRMC